MAVRYSWINCSQIFLLSGLFLQMTSTQQQESQSQCLGCKLFNFSYKKDNEKKNPGVCMYPCECPNEVYQCENGAVPVKDGCSCCYMCPRQLGDMCSKKDKCDLTKGLFCDSKDENSVGICRGKNKKPCNVDGVFFQDGEKFQPHCSQLCTCQIGFYGCVNQCPQELNKPSEVTCHEPKLIKVNNKCCREWSCQKMEASSSLYRGMESENLLHHDRAHTPEVMSTPRPIIANHRMACEREVTNWSPCMDNCGVSVSVRKTIEHTCKQRNETQLCYIRPCGAKVSTWVPNGSSKCTPTTRSQGKQYIRYHDCTSIKRYQLKFCTNCKADKCCYPSKCKRKKIQFRCQNEIVEYDFRWIKKCRCDKECYKRDCEDEDDKPRNGRDKRWRRHLRSQRNKRFIA